MNRNITRFETKGLPWAHGLGQEVKDCVTSYDVIKQANLDWNVKKCELVAQMPFMIEGNNEINQIEAINGSFSRNGYIYRNLPEAYATYRTDKNIPLGLVKSKYEVVQNTDAFRFFDEAIGDNCEWQYAGMFGQGHKIFITAKIKISTDITTNSGKDPLEHYLVFSNSHDGSSSITIMFTPIRVFCTNCLNAGLDKSDSYIRIRHTESVREKLHQGSEVLKIACEKAKDTKQLYDALYTITMKDEQVLEYIADLNLTDKEKQALLAYDNIDGYKRLISKDYMTMENTGISVRKANTILSMYQYYFEGVAQENIIGTAYGAYNAITGYMSNVANLDGEKRMESLLYGTGQNVMQKALIGAYEIAKAA